MSSPQPIVSKSPTPKRPILADAQPEPDVPFHIQWHQRVLQSGKGRTNEDGSLTTVRSGVYGVDGKHYILPTYDPDTGGNFKSPVRRFSEEIKSGAVTGYATPQRALAAEKAARHRWIEPPQTGARQ